jgi:hypothetical protein
MLYKQIAFDESRQEMNATFPDRTSRFSKLVFFTGIEDPFFTIRVGSDIGYLDIPLSGIVDQCPVLSDKKLLPLVEKTHKSACEPAE